MENPLSQLPIPLLGWYQTHARDRAGNHLAGPTLRRSGRDPLSSEKDPKPLGGLGSFPRLLYRCCWGRRNPHPWSQAKRRTLLASTWPPPS